MTGRAWFADVGTADEAVPGVPGQGLVRAPLHGVSWAGPGAAMSEQHPIAERDVICGEQHPRYPEARCRKKRGHRGSRHASFIHTWESVTSPVGGRT